MPGFTCLRVAPTVSLQLTQAKPTFFQEKRGLTVG